MDDGDLLLDPPLTPPTPTYSITPSSSTISNDYLPPLVLSEPTVAPDVSTNSATADRSTSSLTAATTETPPNPPLAVSTGGAPVADELLPPSLLIATVNAVAAEAEEGTSKEKQEENGVVTITTTTTTTTTTTVTSSISPAVAEVSSSSSASKGAQDDEEEAPVDDAFDLFTSLLEEVKTEVETTEVKKERGKRGPYKTKKKRLQMLKEKRSILAGSDLDGVEEEEDEDDEDETDEDDAMNTEQFEREFQINRKMKEQDAKLQANLAAPLIDGPPFELESYSSCVSEFTTVIPQERVMLPETDTYKLWRERLNSAGKQFMFEFNLDLLEVGQEVVFFPEGYNIVQSFCEKVVAAECIQGRSFWGFFGFFFFKCGIEH